MFATGFAPWHILLLFSFPLVLGVIAFVVVRVSSRSARTVGYAPAGDGVPVAPVGTNGLAIASLVLGILWLSWIGSLLALVFGYIARSQIRRSGEGGGGLALAGVVLGWVGVATLALVLLFGIAVSGSGGSTGVVVTH